MEDTKICKGCGYDLPLAAYGTYLYKHKDVCERKRHGKCKKCNDPTPPADEVARRKQCFLSRGVHVCNVCKEERPISLFTFHLSGHNAGRPRGSCKSCHTQIQANHRASNPEKQKKIAAKSYKNNRHKRLTEVERAKRNVWSKRWAKANPDKARALAASRRAQKLQATPAWVDKHLVGVVYAKAFEWSKILGMDMTVDHIVPLKSDYVCGLHVQDNLQLMEFRDNSEKGNREWPYMSEMTPELEKIAREFNAKVD